MRLTWHIVKKDLRRLWPWLAVLVGLMLSRFLAFHQSWSAGEIAPWLSTVDNTGIALEVLVILLIVAALVHDDSVAGGHAFWVTRPIRGERLLCAKLLSILLVTIAAPLFALLAWWLFNGLGWREIQGALPLELTRLGATALAGWSFAIITRTLGGFLLSLVGTAISFSVLVWFWMNAANAQKIDTLGATRTLVGLVIALAAIATAIILQYRSRRTTRTVALYLAAATAIPLCTWFWTWDLRPFLRSFKPASIPTPVEIGFASARLSSLETIDLHFTTASLPPDCSVDFQSIAAHWIVRDGDTTTRTKAKWKSELTPVTATPPSGTPFNLSLVSRPPLAASFSLPPDWKLPPGKPPAGVGFTAKTTLRLRRAEIVAELPLQPGAQQQTGAFALRILDVETPRPNRKLDLSIVERRPRFVGDETLSARKTDVYYLIDASRRILDSDERPASERETRPYRGSTWTSYVGLTPQRLTFSVSPGTDLSTCRLVHVIKPLLGRFEREVTIPDLSLSGR